MSLEDFTTPILLRMISEASTDSLLTNLLLLENYGPSALLSQILHYTDFLSNNNVSPLLWSVMHRFHPLTLLLLDTDRRIDINAQNTEGLAALHMAVIYGDVAIVELLLEQEGVDVNIMDFYGQVPLHYAVTEDWGGGANMREAGFGGLRLGNQSRPYIQLE
ncbi:ankyrin repeat-containing domain protein [Morchella snyderi]|nr:ankyrin repeat-containing domain protein [Morchella snyderi]